MQQFLVNIDLYNTQVLVHCGAIYELLPALQARLPHDAYREVSACFENVNFSIKAKAVMDTHTGALVLWMREPWKKNPDPDWIGTLSHEIFHIVEMMFDRIGIPLSIDTSEAYAYAIEYVTKRIYDCLYFNPSH